jgi:anti-sigma regulatory factor (Ser/Thr protein kinase)
MEVAVPQSVTITVHDQSQVGDARRQAVLLAGKIGLDEEASGRLSIVTTEAGRNLYLHGGGGEIILNALEPGKQAFVELLAIDRGRGMQDVEKCMRDGYSTAGTPGNGMGAIARMADRFDVHSAPGTGTVVMARFFSRRNHRQHDHDPFEFSASSVPYPGEKACGDAWAARGSSNSETFLLVDGLGHGEYAEIAAREAVRIFDQHHGAKPSEIIGLMHSALRSTRGAAVAITRIEPQQQRAVFAGIGNISALILVNDVSRNMVSLSGIVGHHVHKVQEFSYPWTADSLLVMHSDGLNTRWDLNSYLGLSRRATGVIGGVLYRDFQRHRDDTTVLVARATKK